MPRNKNSENDAPLNLDLAALNARQREADAADIWVEADVENRRIRLQFNQTERSVFQVSPAAARALIHVLAEELEKVTP